MGSNMACLFKQYLVELFIVQYEHAKPILYKRCIDYVVGAALCSEKCIVLLIL